MKLRLDQIQSEIVLGYQRGGPDVDPVPRRADYVLARFDKPDEARAFVSRISNLVTYADRSDRKRLRVNLGFTLAALVDYLGWSCANDLFPVEFQKGMAARALSVIGDCPEDLKYYEFSDGNPGRFPFVHAIVMVQGQDAGRVDRVAASIESFARTLHIATLRQGSARLAENRENFGFVDGISQPAFEGLGGRFAGNGAVDATGDWRAIKVGELVLGYEDEAGPWAGPRTLADGSFFVLRKLEQHVGTFEDFITTRNGDLEPAKLAATIVGRWRNGTPLMENVDKASDDQPTPPNNNFRYANDPAGFRCPHGAHIRRANPRDSLGRPGDRAERHRIARRALMYRFEEHAPTRLAVEPDAPHPQGEAIRDGSKRGMMFGAFNASIARQFEFIQSSWLNLGESAREHLYTFRDPLVGDNSKHSYYVVPGEPFHVVEGLSRFVTPRGGGYFFLPGRRLLEQLAHGEAPDEKPSVAPLRLPRQRDNIFSGLFRLVTLPTAIFTQTKKILPEQELVIAMAPIRDGCEVELAKLLDDSNKLDRLFMPVYEKAPDGTPRLASGMPNLHHIRFVIVDNFFRWNDKDEHGVDEAPKEVPLPHHGPYLLCAAWYDGAPLDYWKELADALHTSDVKFPLEYCYLFPERKHAGIDAIEAFYWRFGLATAFSYQGYPSTTREVRKALSLRSKFVALLGKLRKSTGPKEDVETFLDENKIDLD